MSRWKYKSEGYDITKNTVLDYYDKNGLEDEEEKEWRKYLEQLKKEAKEVSKDNLRQVEFDKFLDTAMEAGKGFVDGVVSGAESVLNGASIGGYGWLDRKYDLGFEERKELLQKKADDAGVGDLNKVANFVAEVGGNAQGLGGATINSLSKLGMKGLKLAAATGLAESTIKGFTDSDKWDDVMRNVAVNNALGIPLSVAGYGAVKAGARGFNRIVDEFDGLKAPHYPGMEGADSFVKGFRGRPEEGIEELLKRENGYIRGAMKKDGIGDIDFVYGNDKYGLKHIIDRRNSQGIDGEKFVREIPELIENGSVYSKIKHKNAERNYISDGVDESVIRNKWNGDSKNWLLSGYNLDDLVDASAGRRTLDRNYYDKMIPLSNTQSVILPSVIDEVKQSDVLKSGLEKENSVNSNEPSVVFNEKNDVVNKELTDEELEELMRRYGVRYRY